MYPNVPTTTTRNIGSQPEKKTVEVMSMIVCAEVQRRYRQRKTR
jgi:hypothetical protein